MITEIKNSDASISLYSDSFNKRIRIDDYAGNTQAVLALITESTPRWAEKLIIKSREADILFFQSNGFTQEAFIQGYFNGVDMFFLTRYFSEARGFSPAQAEAQQIVEKIVSEERLVTDHDLKIVSLATREDADELSRLFASIFKVYPTPLDDSNHIRKTMEEGTIYVVIREDNKIVSVASAEINQMFNNAELTDCATLPEAQGKGYMKKLLLKLEEVLRAREINCLYTIARSQSYSMNKAFYQLGYVFGGSMINNCYIYSGLEDMNVWYKPARS